MVVLADTHPTLLDVTKRLNPMGEIDAIAEVLNQYTPIADNAVWLEANSLIGHRTTIRTGIPEPVWRKLYGGVQPTKSTTAQVTESLGMLENYAEVDAALVELNGNERAFRLSEEMAIMEGFAQKVEQSVFNASEATTPEAFTGLKFRYNSKTAANGENIINAGATGSTACQSIYLVVWGPRSVHMIYPKGSVAGLRRTDKGKVTIENADGANGRMEAYRTHYKWDCGLCVRDWRYVVRIANIDIGALTKNGSSGGSGSDLVDLMTQAFTYIPSLSGGRAAFYGSRTIESFLRRQIVNKTATSTLTMENIAGRRVVGFDGIPFFRSDALATPETASELIVA